MQPWFRKDEQGRWSIEALRSLATTLEVAPVGALSGSAAMIRDVAEELERLRVRHDVYLSLLRIVRGRADCPAAKEGEG